MKILIFNWQDITNPLAGGAEVHLHETFSRIAKRGHEVTLYCSSFPGAAKEENVNGIRVIREGSRYLFNYYVPVRYLTRFRKENYDLVIDDNNKLPFFTPLYVREPLMMMVHHLFGNGIFQEAPFPFALYVYMMENLGYAVARSHHVPCIVCSPSKSTKADLIERGFAPDSVSLVDTCVDPEKYHPDSAAQNPTPLIGYVGRLKKYKSVDQLIQAFAIVKKEFPALRLAIVGDGDYRKPLEALARRLGIIDSIEFAGFVSEEQKVKYYQRLWFAVLTSLKEGWGLTVTEANACGKAVIASNVPGLRDAVQDGSTGLLYEFGNIQDLAQKIRLLMTDGKLRASLSIEAVRWANSFGWDNTADQVEELLERYLSLTTKSK
ncbi:MAG TPA: glycosyltransferase family 4 protein [Bacteroidota bacterium]|nr:glycosyltransferase family 4 protein [Bacteroidota bacterium]